MAAGRTGESLSGFLVLTPSVLAEARAAAQQLRTPVSGNLMLMPGHRTTECCTESGVNCLSYRRPLSPLDKAFRGFLLQVMACPLFHNVSVPENDDIAGLCADVLVSSFHFVS